MISVYFKKMAPWLIPAIFLVSLDRLLKVWASGYLVGKKLFLAGDFIKLDYAANKYIAFSLPFAGPVLIGLIIALVFALLYMSLYYSRAGKYTLSGLLLVIAFGAISNLYDRLAYGYVVDYIDMKYFTVFNIADTMIVVCTVLFILLNIKKHPTGGV